MLMLPPPDHAPFPADPLRVKVVESLTVMMKVPLAAVFPPTPLMETCAPVCSPLGSAVVMVMGVVFDAPVMATILGTGSLAIASLMDCSSAVACAEVKVNELWLVDWPRIR